MPVSRLQFVFLGRPPPPRRAHRRRLDHPHVEATLDGCDALVLECNHDPDLLQGGDYPPPLKARIAGRFGHLDNAAAAGLLRRMDCGRLQHVVAAHLSEKNNRPELARAALGGGAGLRGGVDRRGRTGGRVRLAQPGLTACE